MKIRASSLAMAILLVFVSSANAQSGWFESGDTRLRVDLLLLNDAGIIRLPTSHWPLPRASLEHALSNAKADFATNSAVQAALERVRARLEGEMARSGIETFASAGEPGLLRDFDMAGREQAELGAALRYDTPRVAVTLRARVTDAEENESRLRADGSDLSVRIGNWILSANTLDRFWGPAHESSLILSNNARPMPTLMVERAEAREFSSPWLHWLGPWRFSFGISQMESNREDIDQPLFMAWRVTVMPWRDIEVGFSRTAQFCGNQLVCDFNSFANMLAGNDNVGIDATPENEPGNQMAGFDIRWGSPIGDWPYAIYSQFIGEDESSYLPVKFLHQFGLETWKTFPDGGLIQGFAEYSDTACSANRSRPRFNCAYNQGRFNLEGYRYRGRVVGHTADRDAQALSIGGTYTSPAGSLWSFKARSVKLNRDDVGDVRNTVSADPADHQALEVGWRGSIGGQEIGVDLGVESILPRDGGRDTEPFGFISWRREFALGSR